MGPLLASHAVRSGAGRAWNSRGRTSRVGATMVIVSENSGDWHVPGNAMDSVAITRIPRTATSTAGPSISRHGGVIMNSDDNETNKPNPAKAPQPPPHYATPPRPAAPTSHTH